LFCPVSVNAYFYGLGEYFARFPARHFGAFAPRCWSPTGAQINHDMPVVRLIIPTPTGTPLRHKKGRLGLSLARRTDSPRCCEKGPPQLGYLPTVTFQQLKSGMHIACIEESRDMP
jgi:hypothetical protein